MSAPLANGELKQHAPRSLAAVHLSWGFPNERQIAWLLDQKIEVDALADPYPIGATKVRFDGDTFDVDLDGVPALTFRAKDHGEVIDLVAWSPRNGAIASWRGVGFCVGDVDDVFNPGTYALGSALRIHADPIAWLKADRQGIVIVNSKLTYTVLAKAHRVLLPDEKTATQFSEWIKPPLPTVEIYIAKNCRKEI